MEPVAGTAGAQPAIAVGPGLGTVRGPAFARVAGPASLVVDPAAQLAQEVHVVVRRTALGLGRDGAASGPAGEQLVSRV